MSGIAVSEPGFAADSDGVVITSTIACNFIGLFERLKAKGCLFSEIVF